MKKYSSIISNFKNKFELYVFHSENEDDTHLYSDKNLGKYKSIKEYKKEEDVTIYFKIIENNLLDELFLIFSKTYNVCRKDIEKLYSSKNYKSKNQMKLDMMKERNELFELLSSFSFFAPIFKLNLNFDYNMYEYSEIIKKYNHYVRKLGNINKKQIRLTQNIFQLIVLLTMD